MLYKGKITMEREEFWKRKLLALKKLLAGVILFLCIAIFMLCTFMGMDFGIISQILTYGNHIPLGCVFLFFLMIWNGRNMTKALRWPK
jgi:hypothetical protein